MTRTIRQLSNGERDLPSRFGHFCLVLVVAVSGCATDDDEPAPICTTRVLRIDEVTIPGTNSAAKVVAFDLDGDHAGDNQLGMVAGVVQSELDVNLSNAVNARLTSDLVWELAVRDCDDGTQTLVGGDEMPVAAMFDPSGTIADAGWITGIRSAVFIEPYQDRWQGRLGLGLPTELVTSAFTVPIAEYLTNHGLFLAFDNMPKDGTITPQELASTGLVKSLLAPDLDDGKLGISFAVSFTAVER